MDMVDIAYTCTPRAFAGGDAGAWGRLYGTGRALAVRALSGDDEGIVFAVEDGDEAVALIDMLAGRAGIALCDVLVDVVEVSIVDESGSDAGLDWSADEGVGEIEAVLAGMETTPGSVPLALAFAEGSPAIACAFADAGMEGPGLQFPFLAREEVDAA